MENTQMKPAEMLEQVNKAIAAVLVGGQSYKIGSRSMTGGGLAQPVPDTGGPVHAEIHAGRSGGPGGGGHPLPPAGSDLCGLL